VSLKLEALGLPKSESCEAFRRWNETKGRVRRYDIVGWAARSTGRACRALGRWDLCGAVTASETAAGRPSCGVFSTAVKGQVSTSPCDIPYGENRIIVRWNKTRCRTLSPPCAPAATPTSSVHRLHRFLTWCIDSQIPELLTLAATIDTWWPDINSYIRTGIPNAAPRATTASSNRSNASDADSATQKTPPAGNDSTAPANSGQQPGLQACPVRIEADI
jgi:hypothetical protein